MPKDGLAIIFGQKPGKDAGKKRPLISHDEDYPDGFEDACERAFDAVKDDDSEEFCRSMHDAWKALEADEHERLGEESERDSLEDDEDEEGRY